MSSFTLSFTPWGHFRARQKKEEIRRWMESIGQAGTEAFRSGMGQYPGPSAPGAWPNTRSGRLKGSIDYEVSDDSVTIGTNTPYSGFLRTGTSRMARRKMSDNALQEGMRAGRLGKWVEWTRG